MGLRKNILLSPEIALVKDKGSKFIAHAQFVQNEEEIRALLEQLKKEHFGASHWCYAWRLGELGEKYRTNDDGEPAGSAGRPILAAIDAVNLSNIVVIVVRYFGGTLLGVRGLINAYGGAAVLALTQAKLAPMPIPRLLLASFSYAAMAEVQKVVNELDIKPRQVEYQNNQIDMSFEADIERIEQLNDRLARIYGVEIREDSSKSADN